MGATGDDPRAPSRRVAQRAPGLALAVLVAATAVGAGALLSATDLPPISAVFLAIVVGLVVGSRLDAAAAARLRPGLVLASGTVLRLAIVLLGLRFSVGSALAVGGQALGTITLVVVVGLATAWLGARAVGVDPTLGLLIGIGTAICGNSAIAAAAPLLRARDDQVSFASVVITVFGMFGMVVLPPLARLGGLDAQQFGIIAGAGVHDAAQAIASGFLFSDEAGGVATLVKLARTAYLVPLVVVLALRRRDPAMGGVGAQARAALPAFAVGFLAAAGIRSVGDALFADGRAWLVLLETADVAAAFLLATAMGAIGLRTRLDALRSVGRRPLLVGLLASFAAAATAVGGALLIG